jgi:hypothetical protein
VVLVLIDVTSFMQLSEKSLVASAQKKDNTFLQVQIKCTNAWPNRSNGRNIVLGLKMERKATGWAMPMPNL